MPDSQPSPRLILPTRGRYYCPVVLPWFSFARRDTPAARLRLAAYRCMPPRSRWPWLTRLRYLLQWPILAGLASLRAVRSWGGELERHAGIGRWRQFTRLYRRCLVDNVPPHAWYLFRMWTPAGRAAGADYLQEFESHWLLRWMNGGGDPAVLLDKRVFAAACRQAGLRATDNVVELDEDGERWPGGPAGELPAADLFVKLAVGLCGKEAELWRHDPAGGAWRNGAELLDQQALLARLRERARRGGRVVQRRLVNHPALAGFSRHALCTLRMVTWRLPGGAARHFQTCLRMPVGDAVVDNFTPGGISAAVSADGILLGGGRRYVEDPPDTHPDSGATIRGTAIPFWQEAVALACTAHERLDLAGIIGWDIAVTAEGPVLVEGNGTWGTDLMQVGARAPLGGSELPDIVRQFVARLGAPIPVKRSFPSA